MGFWIFMLAVNLLCPMIMIGFGRYFIQSAGPKEINVLFGYRSAMSMKNKETWAFAHVYCGKLWRAAGWALLPVSVAVMLCVLGREAGAVGTAGAILCAGQCLVLMASIIPTELALRKRFDSNGAPKQKESAQ